MERMAAVVDAPARESFDTGEADLYTAVATYQFSDQDPLGQSTTDFQQAPNVRVVKCSTSDQEQV